MPDRPRHIGQCVKPRLRERAKIELHRFRFDERRRIVGVLGYADLWKVMGAQALDPGRNARDLMRPAPPTCHPDDSLSRALERFQTAGQGRLPVVSPIEAGAVVGVISHRDLLAASHRLVADGAGKTR